MRDEAEAASWLIDEIFTTCAALAPLEVIVVDDGSRDGTVAQVRALMARHPGLRLLAHAQSAGQSAAVHSGVLAARAALVCTMDGDGQNPPADLPRLVAPLLADAAGRVGLVAGQRVGRKDTFAKRLASRFANGLRGWLLKDGTRDTGCGLKAFRRTAYVALPYFDHMHRYLPALFNRDGWGVVLVDVGHRERAAGRSKYTNLQRALVGLHDLVGVAWLIRRRKKAVAAEWPALPHAAPVPVPEPAEWRLEQTHG
ncbi:glycosyltransferase family 2 protein [Fertoebacter nigrum]|uniref:Glycosyltransferase family 2 protein n=2 Tax=Fertoeibacter niger TaxID=2656921 RepID=A0A8X8KJC4_9RHOB|nr:glycosyltransferase family 2 protein [Fertoeibacter niger]